ncbi:hypothetical protein K1T71_006094 [Dendrolimus kikuchii]|uniref:Uncharacterized protein n=1 Tax=Dendrolimus kikuchii TaxID=765133 RepID=A0ACC1D349_9NEOP|nr:hypothetical protein K1T71_006094 [Dendrolimus kikuchii]
MDYFETPSGSDSDIESFETVESLRYLDIEELDEVEYALPASEAPTLAEVLSTEEEENYILKSQSKEEPSSCSALQVDFLQAVSQQLTQAQERSFAGAPTALSVGCDGKLTVGTAHGHLLTFFEQTLRWVCDSNTDRGAISCLAYNKESTRLLAGYARGLICQYDALRGTVLRRVTLGGEIWGTLKVTWAGHSGLALDTGGSVWLIKFSRPLGVRSARTSCLFSGARGEVVAMAARDARILALATLSRVIIVAGGHAAGLRVNGPPDTLPTLVWSETDDRILLCARATTLQWLSMTITGSAISLKPTQRIELKTTPLWLGWLGGNIAIFDADENLRLWGDNYDKPLDLSHIEPVYASVFFKGHWTDGRVSKAMCRAGASALGGACAVEGTFALLGRRGVVRVRPREALTRAHAFFASGRYSHALKLLCSAQGSAAKELSTKFIISISQRPHIVNNKQVADLAVKLCLKYDLSEELWGLLWEACSKENAFVEAVGDAAVRGDLSAAPPSPDSSQALIERLAEFEPELVERVVASLPLMSLDPHRASVFTRSKGLWRGVAAIAATLGGCGGAMRELMPYVDAECGRRRARGPGGACGCAGAALVVAAADALAGRGAGGRPLPEHARPSARHDALLALLASEAAFGGRSPLRVLVEHEAAAGVRLLEQCSRDPPFVGPLGKQNRLRVARALLAFSRDLHEPEDRIEILEFITGQLNAGVLPADQEVINGLQELAVVTEGERADRAWLATLGRVRPDPDRLRAQVDAAEGRPRMLWRLTATLQHSQTAFQHFFDITNPSSSDVDEFFEYLRSRIADDDIKSLLEAYLPALINLRPRAVAALVKTDFEPAVASYLKSYSDEHALEFGEALRETGRIRGAAAAAHLRNVCMMRPGDVDKFLAENCGFVRPEDALHIIKEVGPKEALPICLEATGDPKAALDALLELATSSEVGDAETRFITAAGELCARVSPTVPPSVAAGMWTQLLRTAKSTPPSVLLEAVSYLPLDETLGRNCDSPEIAVMILSCAANRKESWKCVSRIAGREAHDALARALAAAGRGCAVRGACRTCGRRLADGSGAVTGHCARATHAECAPEARCRACGHPAAGEPVVLPSRPPRRDQIQPADFDGLLLTAPPRPDLEGIV